jgi:GAF domain-containing protein
MEPLPEVVAGIDELAAYLQKPHDLPGQLEAVGQVAAGLVPSVVAVSLSIVVEDETFTVTATDPSAELLDAGQYLDEAGPCLRAIETGEQVVVDDILDEDRWQTFRQAGARTGVRSSLSLPLRDDADRITGALNIYASQPAAFDGMEAIFAAVFHAQVSEVVKNADLSFRTGDWARELPTKLQARKVVDRAVGLLMGSRNWTAEHARGKLRAAASRAGVDIGTLAAVVLDLAA